MKKGTNTLRVLLGLFVMTLLVVSCSDDNDDTPLPEEQLTESELQAIMESDDVSGVVDNALADIFINDTNNNKSANDCYTAEYTDTGFTAVFNNCYLNGTDNINGTLTVTYTVGQESSSFTATYDSFFAGDIELNGTRTFAFTGNMETNSYAFSVTSNMTATLADGSTLSENGTKTVAFTFGDSLESSTFSIDGDWTVVADGNTYTVSVTDALIGNLNCSYLTTGTMDVSKNGLEVTVDFGDGTCDDTATVIYPNGATEDISLRRD